MSANFSESTARFMRVPPGMLAACAMMVLMGAGILQAQTSPAEETLYQWGLKAFQAHDYAEAEQIFRTLYLDRHDTRGLMGMTESLASQNRMDDAIKEMDKAIAAEPARQDLILARANLFVRAQRYEEAIGTFKGLLEREPGSADLLFRLAETYRRNRDINLAADTFRKASQAAPSNTLPLLQLGLILETIGPINEAKSVYERILKLDPNNAIALNNLAFRKAEEGQDLDGALTMAQRARQIQPDAAAMLDTLNVRFLYPCQYQPRPPCTSIRHAGDLRTVPVPSQVPHQPH